MASVDDLERRVVALESRVRATEVDMGTVNEKLNGIIGGQDVMLGILRGHGEMLIGHDVKLDSHDAKLDSHGAKLDSHDAKLDSHGAKLDSHGAKLDIIVGWIQSQP